MKISIATGKPIPHFSIYFILSTLRLSTVPQPLCSNMLAAQIFCVPLRCHKISMNTSFDQPKIFFVCPLVFVSSQVCSSCVSWSRQSSFSLRVNDSFKYNSAAVWHNASNKEFVFLEKINQALWSIPKNQWSPHQNARLYSLTSAYGYDELLGLVNCSWRHLLSFTQACTYDAIAGLPRTNTRNTFPFWGSRLPRRNFFSRKLLRMFIFTPCHWIRLNRENS